MKCLGSVICIVLAAGAVFADQPKRGVLPDGRPFRTDVNGNQIVDYIAELENAVDNLNRRIYGLEIELESKQALLDRYQSRDKTSPVKEASFTERSLPVEGGSDSEFYGTEVKDVKTVKASTRKTGESEARLIQEKAAFERELAARNAVIDDLKAQLIELKEKNRKGQESLEIAKASLSNKQAEKEAEIVFLKKELAEKEANIAGLESEIASLGSQVKSLKVSLRDKESLEKALKAAEEAALAAKKEAAAARASAETSIKEAARVREVKPEVVKTADSRASLSVQRLQALESAKGMVRTELNKLKSLIGKRSSLYGSYTSAKRDKPVSFKLSKLRSSRGETIDSVARRIKNASRMVELSRAQGDIKEIRAKVNDDIALIRRLSRIK